MNENEREEEENLEKRNEREPRKSNVQQIFDFALIIVGRNGSTQPHIYSCIKYAYAYLYK